MCLCVTVEWIIWRLTKATWNFITIARSLLLTYPASIWNPTLCLTSPSLITGKERTSVFRLASVWRLQLLPVCLIITLRTLRTVRVLPWEKVRVLCVNLVVPVLRESRCASRGYYLYLQVCRILSLTLKARSFLSFGKKSCRTYLSGKHSHSHLNYIAYKATLCC